MYKCKQNRRDNNIEAVISSQINSKYEQVSQVAAVIPAITKLANILDSHVDFNLLANVLGNLDSITAAKLGQLATADLVTMTNDLAKGNYLGNRKLDIDLSLNIGSNGLAIYYRQVDIISVEGIRVSYPFYASGTTVISETYIKSFADINT